MKKQKIFYELVIEGSLPLIKGFIFGLLEGGRKKGTVIFSQENNIKAETLIELLLERMHLKESLWYVIVEEKLLKYVEKGLTTTTIDLKLKSVKKIKTAAFKFHYEVYAEKLGKEIKKIFKKLPVSLKMSPDYQPEEETHPEGKGIEAFAPCHEYALKAQGEVEGPLAALLSLYQKLDEYEVVTKEQINLHLEE